MADWTELDTNGLLPGEPFTSAKALAFFENPVAMAEGAVNAPKVVSGALDMFVGTGTGTTAYTNLGRVNKLLITVSGNVTDTRNLIIRYRTSTDNGATYGGYTTIISMATGTLVKTASVVVSLGAANAIQIDKHSAGGVGDFEMTFTILGVSGISP